MFCAGLVAFIRFQMMWDDFGQELIVVGLSICSLSSKFLKQKIRGKKNNGPLHLISGGRRGPLTWQMMTLSLAPIIPRGQGMELKSLPEPFRT